MFTTNILTKIFPDSLKPYSKRIVLTVLGFITAILFLTLGFWKTLLLVILTCIGYFLGKWADGALDTTKLPLPTRWK